MEKMTFKDFYLREKRKLTAAQTFVKRIAEITKRSEHTVRMWVHGTQVPDALAQYIISKEFGVEASELFPKS